MCGIAGIVDTAGGFIEPMLLQAMTGILGHRGPDGEGLFVRGSVGLGHRRLAIIDLLTGDQPMVNDDGAVAIVFNGEIYNFREVRKTLKARGARFRTDSDTEVILRAYELEGADCVRHLRGMFAFAIFDERAGHVMLARDRLGIKPLVYAWDGQRLVFASELKAILQDPRVPRDLDAEALCEYLTYHYVPTPRTIFRSVRKLPPASTLVLPLRGGDPVVSRYWNVQFAAAPPLTEDEWVERLEAQLREAVRLHMVSDVPIGAFLSGGMDSSAVVAMMAESSSRPVRTFSVGFDATDFNELAFARQVADRYATQHHEVVIKPDALEVLPRLAWQFDEPFADSSAIPTYYVSKVAREHVTVALSGDGGDEGLAGYRRYSQASALQARLDGVLGGLARPLLRLASRVLPVGTPGQGYCGLLGSEGLDRYFRLVTFQRRETLASLLSRDLAGISRSVSDATRFQRLAAESGTPEYVSQLQYVDLKSYLPDDILTKVDRASMLVSLETRVPLLDHVLVEFLATVPVKLKLSGGEGKYILKRAMVDRLPPDVLTRPKMGFGVPLAAWLRNELRDLAHDVLLSPRARQRGLFRAGAVESLLRAHDSGRHDRSAQIWALLFLEMWSREWIDR